MGFNSAFKGLKLLKNPGNGRLNNLNDPVLNVLMREQCGLIMTFLSICVLYPFKYEGGLKSSRPNLHFLDVLHVDHFQGWYGHV